MMYHRFVCALIKAGMTQQEIADKVGLTQARVCQVSKQVDANINGMSAQLLMDLHRKVTKNKRV